MNDPNQSQNTQTTDSGSRRRSSGFMPAFQGLQQERKNADPARRQSMSDQAAKGGVFSQMFHNTFGRNAK